MTDKGTWIYKKGLAEILKSGVIMDVTIPEQAKIAEEAGACAVMALERVPSDIRAAGGVATPAGAALMILLGTDGVFVGLGIFKSENPAQMAKAIVQAVTHYSDPQTLTEIFRGGWQRYGRVRNLKYSSFESYAGTRLVIIKYLRTALFHE